MEPSGAGTQGQICPDDHHYNVDDVSQNGNTTREPVSEDADCGTGADRGLQQLKAKEEDGAPLEIPTEQRGWRRVVRNFTPS